MGRLNLYQVDMKYVRNLHNADDRVQSVSPQIGKDRRVFVGIVLIRDSQLYCVPLSHPKEKHKRMANNSEIQKIVVDGKLIGVLNFNLMIPITEQQLIPVDLKIHHNDSPEIKSWKRICKKELEWCQIRENEIIIRDKAKNIYHLCTTESDFKGKKRCLDFKKLERVCEKYNEGLNTKKRM